MSSRRALPTTFAWGDFAFDARTVDRGVQGGQGLVVSAQHKSGEGYAVKIIDLTRYDTAAAGYDAEQALLLLATATAESENEAALAMSLSHAFIVPTLGSFVRNRRMFVVMKRLEGSLSVSAIVGDYGRGVQALDVLTELSFAVEQMHFQGIAHGDIKPENVLVTLAGHNALCDFGLASSVSLGDGTVAPSGESVLHALH